MGHDRTLVIFVFQNCSRAFPRKEHFLLQCFQTVASALNLALLFTPDGSNHDLIVILLSLTEKCIGNSRE